MSRGRTARSAPAAPPAAPLPAASPRPGSLGVADAVRDLHVLGLDLLLGLGDQPVRLRQVHVPQPVDPLRLLLLFSVSCITHISVIRRSLCSLKMLSLAAVWRWKYPSAAGSRQLSRAAARACRRYPAPDPLIQCRTPAPNPAPGPPGPGHTPGTAGCNDPMQLQHLGDVPGVTDVAVDGQRLAVAGHRRVQIPRVAVDIPDIDQGVAHALAVAGSREMRRAVVKCSRA